MICIVVYILVRNLFGVDLLALLNISVEQKARGAVIVYHFSINIMMSTEPISKTTASFSVFYYFFYLLSVSFLLYGQVYQCLSVFKYLINRGNAISSSNKF